MGDVIYGTGYIKSVQGIIKILELLTSLIGLILIAIDGWVSDLTNAFIVGAGVALIISLIFILLHITKLGSPIHGFLAFQIYFNIIWFLYLLIVSAVVLGKRNDNRHLAGGSFGIITAFLYLVDAGDCYRTNSSPLFCRR